MIQQTVISINYLYSLKNKPKWQNISYLSLILLATCIVSVLSNKAEEVVTYWKYMANNEIVVSKNSLITYKNDFKQTWKTTIQYIQSKRLDKIDLPPQNKVLVNAKNGWFI